ncbi:MAG: pyridoxal phosphate-dependent aminotransferase [Acidobacteriota bacterium]
MVSLSERIKRISPSPTLKLLKIKNTLKKQGKDILDFGAGEPDFTTPDTIKNRGIEAIRNNHTKYTPVAGIPDLKDAIKKSYFEEQGFEPDDEQIIVTPGSKFGLYLILQAITDSGDEIIVPKPYWVSYPEIVKYSGGNVIYADHLNENSLFKLTAESYIEKFSSKTKAVIINSPSNPTGMIMKSEELKKIVSACVEKDIFILFDDCYRRIIYTDENFESPLKLFPSAIDNIAVISSLSKTFSMTGWRLGYTIAPEYICKAMAKLQGHSSSNPCSISQKAAVGALLDDQPYIGPMVNEYRERKNYIAKKFREIGNINFVDPEGAFYFFPDFTYHIKKMGFADDNDFAMDILNKLNIIVVPGSAFGASNYLRISYATSLEDIRTGLDRLGEYLKG